MERSIRELDMRGSATSPLRDFASHLVEALHELGVSTIILGYPLKVVQDKGNEFTSNVWSYRKLLNTIELDAQEYK
ncbi:hypothetical protein MetMK1DRAFT_00016320 [Metallosphaera yellowstonensis MK1]|uniref:Uncharacterized protein n=1 Tax=Metallosphaera yellowstonensis MK1 TaxID=671065 RepID=H2C537_9CREN|nr:hypothetical protein [Metallosphaera yellowstonensis]EHP71128.1 hypothetical protein MetMK1DRAFT_00016320 [Metallosphaera yellowstonensis MK1]